ncbi:MAG TPA: trypsin-like peptidase domain-containing protein [Acidimicrobiia bacterium]|jgi:serine protease Do
MFPDTDTRPLTPPEDPEPPRSKRPWATVLTYLAALVIGVGIGFLVFTSPSTPVDTDAADPDAATATTAADVDEPLDEALATEEPVAAVAESLLPSVVRIDTVRGGGSGVIYDSDGLILTAAHVVAGTETVQVRLSDGTQYEGRVLGGDLDADVAVVQVDATGLPAAPLALDKEVKVGQLAVAIGSPFGLDQTVTAGVVSAVNQTVVGRGTFQSLIQTDAPINPGNSGGALANRDGEVIGINVSIYSTTGGNIGVGFAVPIDVAYDLAQDIVAGEPIERAILGIQATTAEGQRPGALVISVEPGSGADEAGIERGDVITAIDGVRVTNIGDLVAQVGSHRPGETVQVDLIRDGEPMQLEVTLSAAD